MSTVALLGKTDESERSPEVCKDAFDLRRIERAVREISFAVGEDPDRDGLVETPRRVARAYAELLGGLREDPARHLGRVFEHRTENDDEATVGMKQLYMATYHAVAGLSMILLLIAFAPRSGTAAEIEGVQFAEQYQRDDVTLALHCVGCCATKCCSRRTLPVCTSMSAWRPKRHLRMSPSGSS